MRGISQSSTSTLSVGGNQADPSPILATCRTSFGGGKVRCLRRRGGRGNAWRLMPAVTSSIVLRWRDSQQRTRMCHPYDVQSVSA